MARHRQPRTPQEDPPLMALFLQEVLPADFAEPLHRHLLHPASPFQSLLRQASALARSAWDTALQPLVDPAVASARGLVDANPQVLSWLSVVLTIAAVVLVVRWVQRVVAFWVGLTARVALWACVAALAAAVWQNGVYRSAVALAVLLGKMLGFLAGVKDVWVAEYRRYDARHP